MKAPSIVVAFFYRDEEQKEIAAAYIDKLNKANEFRSKIVTQLEKATTFYPAEEYSPGLLQKESLRWLLSRRRR